MLNTNTQTGPVLADGQDDMLRYSLGLEPVVKAAERLRAGLEEMEWSADRPNRQSEEPLTRVNCCPVCMGVKTAQVPLGYPERGHRDGCLLAQALGSAMFLDGIARTSHPATKQVDQAQGEFVTEVHEVEWHRNGSDAASGFHAIRFRHHDAPMSKDFEMLAIVFPEPGECAVICVDLLDDVGVKFGMPPFGNSWRGDRFEPELRLAVDEYRKRERQRLGLEEEPDVRSADPARDAV